MFNINGGNFLNSISSPDAILIIPFSKSIFIFSPSDTFLLIPGASTRGTPILMVI